MKLRLAGVAASAALLVLAIGAPAAVGSSGTLRVVDDDGAAGVTDFGVPDCSDGFTSTTMPGIIFQTVSAAVAGSTAGDTIYVCPGTYNESVVVDKALRIRGPYAGVTGKYCAPRIGQATVIGSGSYAFDLNADGIIVAGLRIANSPMGGILTHQQFSGDQVTYNMIDHNSVGLDLFASGAVHSTVYRNCFADNNNGAPGAGVRSALNGLANVSIVANGFVDQRKAGIWLDGTPVTVSGVTITGNRSRDEKAFASLTTVTNSLVTGNDIGATDEISAPGSAIAVGGASNSVQVLSNKISSNHTEGVFVKDTAGNVLVKDNTITGVNDGISVNSTTSAAVAVRTNHIRDITGNGLTFAATTLGNLIAGNKVLGVANFHCVDLSSGSDTGDTANHWVNNIGQLASPPEICNPPH